MESSEGRIEEAIDEVFGKYERWANVKYDGEEITLLEHSLQTAALAEENGSTVEIVLGALFHDIGHVLEVEQSHKPKEEWTVTVGKHNEYFQTGHRYLLDMHFPEAIASPALYHVDAKRYLVKAERSYYEDLSETSKRTLIDQGGPMNEQEAKTFEGLPFFKGITQIRKWDDLAKAVNKTTPSLDAYRKLCKKYLMEIAGLL